MDSCFLFTNHLNTTGCTVLKLSEEGLLVFPVQQQSFAEIRILQRNSKTLVVETSTHASYFELELPWLPERKARSVLPYALEDKLSQPVEQLHFAFDKLRYQNARYLIAVLDKQRLLFILSLLAEEGIRYETITLDWFALQPQETLISGNALLVNQDDFKGALLGDLALNYLKIHSSVSALRFQDNQLDCANEHFESEPHSYLWIAQRLLKNKPLNLCQGEFQQKSNTDPMKKTYRYLAVLAGFWLFSLLFLNALHWHALSKKTLEVDKEIETVYRTFFPDAKQVLNPKFQISQLLAKNASSTQVHFWFLLNQFAKAMKEQPLKLEQLRYQNNTLSVTLRSPDFKRLEHIENQLKQAHIKLRQIQAATQEQQVVATLELS